ncbi:MAG: efflux RND transporter periplasmic adaptor subunit [Candidatus Aminicenantes bacterium]|nr:efflux RND transporter periplasmic adaptor subunit [Candidatus Aminicenantes bacterium]
MTKTRKRTAWFLALVLITSLAASCKKSNGGPTPGNNNAAAAAQAKPGGPAGKPQPGAKRPGGEPETESLPVNIETIQRRSLNSYIVLNGIVEPERKVEVFARLSAYVKQIVKEEGALVKEGDVLAVLDDIEVRISHEQARIALDQAKLSLDEAEQNLVRARELFARDLISEQEYQAQDAVHKQRQLDFKNREQSFQNLELQLGWTRIRANASGYITERLIEVGGRINPNQQVFTIEDFTPLLVRVFVPTSDSIKLRTGMSASVATEVIPGTDFGGRVTLINPRIDVQTGTVRVTVEVYDESLRLKPGMFVQARIAVGQKEDVLVIPRKAILYRQNKTYAFVVENGRAAQREIALGLTEEDLAEVLGGLEEGQTIVSVGVENLKDGQPVEVLR